MTNLLLYLLEGVLCFKILHSIFQNVKSYSLKFKENGKLDDYSFWPMINFVRKSFATPKVVDGQKQSLYRDIYSSYLSPLSRYSSKPKVLKLFGATIGVLVYDHESLREIIQEDWCSDRGPPDMLKVITRGKPRGILLNNGEDWKEIKKYSMKQLGKLGFGKNDTMKSILEEEVPDLLSRIELLKAKSGNKIQVNGLFALSIINVIWCIAGGNKFSENDPDFVKLYEATTTVTSLNFFQLRFLSWFKDIKGIRNFFGYKKLEDSAKIMHEIFVNIIDERKSLGLYKSNPQCLVDHFLQEIENRANIGIVDDVYCEEQLIGIIKDLFMAGMDTSSNYLECILMFMVMHPHIQSKVQEEIDLVIGKNCVPQYHEYKKRLPYTMATMMEIHRLSNVVAFSPRSTRKDYVLGGKLLKKETYATMTYFPQRFDETYWEDSHVFSPERFLDNNNCIIQEKVNRLMIFGLGPRACPGENVSLSSSFAMFVGLLQNYRIAKAVDSEILSMNETFGFTNGPEPFHISVFER